MKEKEKGLTINPGEAIMAGTSGLLVGLPPGIFMATGTWPEDAAGIVVMGGIVATLGAVQLKSRENAETAVKEMLKKNR